MSARAHNWSCHAAFPGTTFEKKSDSEKPSTTPLAYMRRESVNKYSRFPFASISALFSWSPITVTRPLQPAGMLQPGLLSMRVFVEQLAVSWLRYLEHREEDISVDYREIETAVVNSCALTSALLLTVWVSFVIDGSNFLGDANDSLVAAFVIIWVFSCGTCVMCIFFCFGMMLSLSQTTSNEHMHHLLKLLGNYSLGLGSLAPIACLVLTLYGGFFGFCIWLWLKVGDCLGLRVGFGIMGVMLVMMAASALIATRAHFTSHCVDEAIMEIVPEVLTTAEVGAALTAFVAECGGLERSSEDGFVRKLIGASRRGQERLICNFSIEVARRIYQRLFSERIDDQVAEMLKLSSGQGGSGGFITQAQLNQSQSALQAQLTQTQEQLSQSQSALGQTQARLSQVQAQQSQTQAELQALRAVVMRLDPSVLTPAARGPAPSSPRMSLGLAAAGDGYDQIVFGENPLHHHQPTCPSPRLSTSSSPPLHHASHDRLSQQYEQLLQQRERVVQAPERRNSFGSRPPSFSLQPGAANGSGSGSGCSN